MPLSKIRRRSVNASAFVIAEISLPSSPVHVLQKRNLGMKAYLIRLRILFSELVCQLEGFAVAVAVMVN